MSVTTERPSPATVVRSFRIDAGLFSEELRKAFGTAR